MTIGKKVDLEDFCHECVMFSIPELYWRSIVGELIKNGKTVDVPADMTYKDWKAEYVKSLDSKTFIKAKNHGTINEMVRRGTGVLPTVRLSKAEYAKVMSEFNTNMSNEQRKQAVVSKPIGDYIYTIENNGFDEYRIIGKVSINTNIKR